MKSNVKQCPRSFDELVSVDFEEYRVPDTPTRLLISYQNDRPIDESDMQRILLQTRLRLRRYVRAHWKMEDEKLLIRDDPYRSDPNFRGYLAPERSHELRIAADTLQLLFKHTPLP